MSRLRLSETESVNMNFCHRGCQGDLSAQCLSILAVMNPCIQSFIRDKCEYSSIRDRCEYSSASVFQGYTWTGTRDWAAERERERERGTRERERGTRLGSALIQAFSTVLAWPSVCLVLELFWQSSCIAGSRSRYNCQQSYSALADFGAFLQMLIYKWFCPPDMFHHPDWGEWEPAGEQVKPLTSSICAELESVDKGTQKACGTVSSVETQTLPLPSSPSSL